MIKKETKGTGQPTLYQVLTTRSARIDSADIDTWKTAVNSAKRGERTKLYNLYENLLADPFLANAIEKRIDAITNAEIAFLKNSESVEAIDDLIDTPAFEELVREIMLSKAWGKSVIETWFAPEFDCFSYPRKHIKGSNLDKAMAEHRWFIAARETDREGLDYTADPRFISCGKSDDLGCLFRAAPYVIYKRGGFGDWARFAEVFGMPFVLGKYNSFDTASRDQLFEALTSMGSNTVAAIPSDADIELKENKSSGSTNLFERFRAACNEEILIAVLGNTMTTLNGGSRAQGNVHRETEEAINRADRRYVQRVLNRHFLPQLIARGYPATGGFFNFPDAGESLSTAERVNIALSLKSAGIKVPDRYLYEISGIPAPDESEDSKDGKKPDEEPQKKEDKKEAKNRHDAPTVQLEVEGNSEGESFAVAQRAETKKDGWLQRVWRFFFVAPTSGSGATQHWSNFTKQNNPTVDIDIAGLVEKALREVYGTQGEGLLVERHLFDITYHPLSAGAKTEVAKMGIEFGVKNAAFLAEFDQNLAVYAAFKNHQQTKDLVALLRDDSGNLRPYHAFKKLALAVSKDYNGAWLRTEYDTAVRAARMACNWKKYQETKAMYPNLEFVESTAAHPRAEHREYVGTILPIEHPWWDTHTPPLDWSCQCSIRPTDKKPTEVPTESEPTLPAFANNPGETAEFIRIEATPYAAQASDPAALRTYAERRVSRFKETIEVEQNQATRATLSISSLHGATELASNRAIGRALTVHGHNVRLLPLLPTNNPTLRQQLLPKSVARAKKNPDALIDNVVFEFKEVKGVKGSKSAVGNSLGKAAKQADSVLLNITGLTEYDVMRALYGKIAVWDKRGLTPARRAWFLLDGKLHKHTAATIRAWGKKQKRPNQ